MGINIDDIVESMSIDEKIAQLGSVRIEDLLDEDGTFSHAKADKILINGVGQITRIAGSPNITPKKAAIHANDIQSYLKSRTKLGIPAIIHEECLCGFMADGATIFPQAIGLASTWEPELVNAMTGIIRRQIRLSGGHQGLSPVLDIALDPRWGRIEETFGEDPYLAANMAVEYVKGLQGDNLHSGVIATLKHFAGHSFSEGGRNCAPANLGERKLRETFLFPFEAAVKEGKAQSVMNAYNEIDGIPCAASHYLLTDILRREWGFEGIVVSDYYAVERLHSMHRTAGDKGAAAVQALEAGMDMELPRTDCFGSPLLEAFRKNLISEDTINTAVKRILAMKERLGLFDRSTAEAPKSGWDFDCKENRILSAEIARKSIVLLKNDGNILPVKPGIKSIAVIGPNAGSGLNLLGDYTYTGHHLSGESSLKIVSILKGITEKAGKDVKLNFAQGCGIVGNSTEGFEKAVEAAKISDIAVLVVGSKSGVMSEEDIDGEERDRAELGLPGVQAELVGKIAETGTPVVMVLVNGRPLVIGDLCKKAQAVIEAWLPGEEGGNAVADILFGSCSPSGKLPVSLLTSAGQIPFCYNRRHSSSGNYVFTENKPAFPFGHGLSYTSFEYSDILVKSNASIDDKKIDIRMTLTNSGAGYGEEVVQLYIQDEYASVTRPLKELKGFKRIGLEPMESKYITFNIDFEMLSFYDRDMKLVIEPGKYNVLIGSSSEDIRLRSGFYLEGPKAYIEKRSVFFTKTTISSFN